MSETTAAATTPPPPADEERKACTSMIHGFHLRPPPPPHDLTTFLTPDAHLFETIHMGIPAIDPARYRLVVDGLVARPFALTLAQLRRLPSTTITTFHECFGSPLQPPVRNPLRIGNVAWTGVPLAHLLSLARPSASASSSSSSSFVWTDGLDRGAFAGTPADRYRKDLPLAKALRPEVLVAWAMNGAPLRRERGGPVRLVVPGWFGTNSTKWLCRIAVRERRADSPFTTVYYNVRDGETGATRPVWAVEPNAIVVKPEDGAVVRAGGGGGGEGGGVLVEGWAWSDDGIAHVDVSADGGVLWSPAEVEPRKDFSWQKYRVRVALAPGKYRISARATSVGGLQQPMKDARNHVHTISIEVVA